MTLTLFIQKNKLFQIVHNYGHGGYGVTAGPGTARDAANLVRQMLTAHSKL